MSRHTSERHRTADRVGPSLAAVALAVAISLGAGSAARAQTPTDLERRTNHGAIPAAGAAPTIPAGVDLADGLSADEAVAVALWNNAAFHADLAALGLARADLVEAGLLKNPILTFLFPLGPKQLEATINFPIEVFWQRPRRVAAARVELDRVATSLEQTTLNLVRDVRVGYADTLLAHDRMLLSQQSVALRRETLALVDARFRAGDVAELEVIAAAGDLRVAEEQLSRREGELAVARSRLRFLVGLPTDGANVDMTGAPVEPAAPADLDRLVRDALAARPDLRAAELAIESAQRRAKWERSRIATLSGILDMNGSGKKGFEAGPGINAEIPVFNRNQGGVRRADAEVERAARQFLATRERILAEVRDAHARLSTARASLRAFNDEIIPTAEETARIAERAYRDGAQSYLFVLDASRRLVDARDAGVQALADARRAAAELERSTGRSYATNP